MFNSRMRNIEIPENLFSNLGEVQTKRIMKEKEMEQQEEEKKYMNEEIKTPSHTRRNEYRERITKMYEDINNLKPIDNAIDNILYFNNYIERGIVVKPKISSLKQFWTEYRLIANEKNIIPEKKIEAPKIEVPKIENIKEKIDSFDQLFDALSIRVEEINKYIDELKEMKNEIDSTSLKLKENEEQLEVEKQEFESYKEKEENKIKEEKENLKINFAKLQTIIDDLDKKLGSVEDNK